MTPYYDHDGITIYNADCRDVLPTLDPVDLVLTDPPYPNAAGHFNDGVEAARDLLRAIPARECFSFWDEMETPESSLPIVARHIWYRTNTNRPDNYEAIIHCHADGRKRPSRVFAYAVIFKGLTGCYEATNHPTQKNEKLIRRMITLSKPDTILDPFMGSGTTLRAAKDLGRQAIGIEIEERYCEIAAERLRQGVLSFEPSEP